MQNESTLDFFQSKPYYLPNLPRLLAATFNFTTFLFMNISCLMNYWFPVVWLEFLRKNIALSFLERWESNQCLVFFEVFFRHTQASVPVERLRLAGKEGTEWVRGSGCTATSESGLSNQSQLKCYSFVDKIQFSIETDFILQKLKHYELRLTFFTLWSGVVSQNVRTEEIFSKRNGPVMLRNHLTNSNRTAASKR